MIGLLQQILIPLERGDYMLDHIPSSDEIKRLIGIDLFFVWEELKAFIETYYETDRLWNSGGKKWVYEYKYRRGGKTLITLYLKTDTLGCMFIFGKEERIKFELIRETLSNEILAGYDEAKTFHDGKWIMYYPKDKHLFEDFYRLLNIKRRPNKK